MTLRFRGAALALAALLQSAPALTSVPAEAAPVSQTKDAIDPAIWQSYKAQFISPEGRLSDDANGNISHSEGQGYAMLLSVFAGDDLGFSRIWGWTVRELYRRGDGLASWKWEPGATPHITDANNATDGDLLIAWALAEAAERWNSPEYKAAAHTIAVAAIKRGSFKTAYGLTLLPGASGFTATEMPDGPIVNLSYWVFPAFQRLKGVAPEVDWDALTASGLALLKATHTDASGLPSDWTSLHGPQPVPAAKFPPTFAYNAIRIPLYLIWGGQADSGALAPFAAAWQGGDKPAVVNVLTGRPVEPFYDQGYQAIAALTLCAASHAPIPSSLNPVKIERYYSTTLHLLSLVAARQRSLSCD